MEYKTIDLCAGIGGIRRGFELAGNFHNILSAEIDTLACKTYEHLFGENPQNDVTSEEFKKKLESLQYDVLLAGFPCQAFSSAGLRKGFLDTTKGTIFFDIADIIKRTQPKAVFLENVENLLSHDKGNTFKTIIKILEDELSYKVIGVSDDGQGNYKFSSNSFVRNSRNFGIPQNRPRVYIVAFNKIYFGEHIKELPDKLPEGSDEIIYANLADVLDRDVEPHFFLSSGYLTTLENHIIRQKKKGNGFGYRIVNAPEIDNPIANTLLATGGSGRERNLIYDFENGIRYAGMTLKGKKTPINNKNIRTMTPTEWGRLQGFIGYAFLDENGLDHFSFPNDISNQQRYKQFGNSVTIPVIKTMAFFMYECLNKMTGNFSVIEKELYGMYGDEFEICSRISTLLKHHVHEKTIVMYFSLVRSLGVSKSFTNYEVANYLGFSTARTSQMLKQLIKTGCLKKIGRYYSFEVLR